MLAEYGIVARYKKLMNDYELHKDQYTTIFHLLSQSKFYRRKDEYFSELERQTFEDFGISMYNDVKSNEVVNDFMRRMDAYMTGENLIIQKDEMQYFYNFYDTMLQLVESVMPIEELIYQVDDNDMEISFMREETTEELVKIREITSIKTFDEVKNFVLKNRCDEVSQSLSIARYMTKDSVFCYDQLELMYRGGDIMIDDLVTEYKAQSYYLIDSIYEFLPPKMKVTFRLVCKYGTKKYKQFMRKYKDQKVFQLVLGNSAVKLDLSTIAQISNKYDNRVRSKRRFVMNYPLENCDLDYITKDDYIESVYMTQFQQLLVDIKEDIGIVNTCKVFKIEIVRHTGNLTMERFVRVKFMNPLYMSMLVNYSRGSSIVPRLLKFRNAALIQRYMISVPERIDYVTTCVYFKGSRSLSMVLRKYDPWHNRQSFRMIKDEETMRRYKTYPFHEFELGKCCEIMENLRVEANLASDGFFLK